MNYLYQFTLEALVVGLATAVVGSAVALVGMLMDPGFRIEEYHFWWQVAVSFFVTGIVMHLGFEWLGINRWYCKYGAACCKR